MKALIVGIDPGSTSAVAALDLDGELILLESRKEFGPDEIIRELIEEGRPVVIASDRAEMPSTVESIASSLGAEKFMPDEDLSRERKKDLGEGENSHEIDASAAARYAFNSMQKEIRKIKQIDEENPAEAARKYFNPHQESSGGTDRVPEKSAGSEERSRPGIKSELGEVRKKNRELRHKVEELEKGIRDDEVEREEIERLEKIISAKNEELELYRSRIRELEDKIAEYREALELVRKDYEPIPKVFPGTAEIPERAVVEDEDMKNRLNSRGFNARTPEELEGLELDSYFIVDEFPEPESLEEILDKRVGKK